MSQDRPFLGILLMLGFCVLAPLGDAMAKVLGGTVALMGLICVRFGVQAILLTPLVLLRGQSLRPPTGTFPKILLRTCLHIAGVALMFSSLRYLPLADALAIAFVMPFIMLILGHFVLHEVVGPHRIWACAFGFVGTLLVIQPNFAAVGWPALLPLGVAVVFALFMLVTRQIAKSIDAVHLQAISGLQALVILIPLLIAFPNVPGFDLSWPAQTDVILLLILGVLGTIAHLMMTGSLRYAPASTLAPMQYLEIPFGTAIGWLIFKDLPNGLAALGICITISAGLYIILREQRLSQLEASQSEASQ
ncbi:MAG: DMT family transporter [Yoonia sp.]|uniref:DMT family transporter n=1 Tax=Yoonia sp. TaxID=2212373 RepID=UPI0032634689